MEYMGFVVADRLWLDPSSSPKLIVFALLKSKLKGPIATHSLVLVKNDKEQIETNGMQQMHKTCTEPKLANE